MHIALSDEHERLRSELRSYFAELVTPDLRRALAASTGEFGDVDAYKGVIRRLGADGWLGIGWPEEWGGQNRSMIEQLIFSDEAAIAGIPIPHLTLNTVGPTIMRFGTDEQKKELLPAILKGEMHFSIGYSEPGSGTDLASLKTRAVARRRRVGHQRPEDVDQPHPVRRLRLARLPHRPGPAAPQGPLDDPGPDRTPTASPTPRCTRSRASRPRRPTTRTCVSRSPTWSAS